MTTPEKLPTEPTTPAPPAAAPKEPTWSDVFAFPLACAGAIIGGAVGVMVVRLAAQSGFYAMPLIGLAVGFGATLIARRHNLAIALIAAIVTITASLLAEWWLFPFTRDGSLTYFVQHIGDLKGFSLLLHGIGAAIAFWIGWRV